MSAARIHRRFDRYDAVGSVLDHADGAEIIRAHAPELSGVCALNPQFRDYPFGPFLETILRLDRVRAASVISQVTELETLAAIDRSRVVAPDPSFDTAPTASASVTVPAQTTQWTATELVFAGPSHGNSFVDVYLAAVFDDGTHTVRVGGFYDGDGVYRIRFLPPTTGNWTFTTTSTAQSLDQISGHIVVGPGAEQGAVQVAGRGFVHQSGAAFVPFGTTAYAWTHQSDQLQQRTLESLAAAPFTKVRMCLFPKSYIFNENDPDLYPFPKDDTGEWDTERFDVRFFRHLEQRIADLGSLGIQADLILFHPYDRWGFTDLGAHADDRYLTYVVRRLAAFPNVWWSLANEYDLMTTKRPADWHRFGELITREDHAHHLLSVHNWVDLFDATPDWVTHCSIQSGTFDLGAEVDAWRARWDKPVILDESGYEGDLDQEWGNLTAADVVDRFWMTMMRGGYATHGETYRNDGDVFWSKGGTLRGESIARIAFLRDLVAQAPGPFEPLPSSWNTPWAGVRDRYTLIYLGRRQPAWSDISIPAGMRAHVDVIDTWNMTVETLPGIHEATITVPLPARPYMAIRLRAAPNLETQN